MSKTTLFCALTVGLCLPACFNKSSTPDSETPTAGGGDGAAADRGRGSVVSKGAEGRKVAVRLKSSKPVRMTKKDADGGEATDPKDPPPARAQRKNVEVAGFSPTAASPGSQVEIFGAGFAKTAAGNTVTVGGTSWTVTEVFADRIVAVVPDGAKDGKLTVKAGKKSVTTEREFIALTNDGGFGKPASAYNALLGEVFVVGEGVTSMPDFSSLGEPTALISAGPLDIPEASFEQGLPGREGRISTNFAVRFTGSLNIVAEAEYELCLASDDGSRLFLEDTMVVDNDGAHATAEKCELVYLEAGEYRVRVEYFQGSSPAVALALRWAQDGGEKAAIPADVLFRPENPSALLP